MSEDSNSMRGSLRLQTVAGFPHTGWQRLRVIDVETDPTEGTYASDPSAACEYCPKERIRYIHLLKHPSREIPIRVGRGCAAKLTGDEVGVNRAERIAKKRAKMIGDFVRNQWTTTRVGGQWRREWRRLEDYQVAVTKKGDKFRLWIDGREGTLLYETIQQAKIAAYVWIERRDAKIQYE